MEKLPVTLTGPAKIDGKREPAGATVQVTATVALQLAANGVIAPPDFDISDTPLASDFDAAVEQAVAARVAEAEAKAIIAEERVATAEARLILLESDLADATALAADETERANKAEAKVGQLEAALAEAATSTNSGAGKKPAEKKAT